MAGSTVSKISIDFGANTQGLKSGVSEAKTSLGSLSKIGGGFGSSIGAASGAAMAGLAAVAAAAAAAAAAVAAVGAAASWGIKLAAQAETAKVGFEVMLGSAAAADKMLRQIQDFSASTPFQFPEIQAASRSLLAFGVEADNIIPSLKSIGDLASGVGMPINELAQIFGKAKVQGTLFAEDINQLTGRGIPVIQEFAKQLGVSEGEVKKLASQGKITFPMLESAFQSLTGEGGKFGGMMEKQSQTLSGKWSTLQDNISAIGRSLGEALMPAAKIALGGISDLVERIGVFVEANGPLIEQLAIKLANAFIDMLFIIGDVIDKTTKWIEWIVKTGRAWGLLDNKVGDFATKIEDVTDAAEEMNEELIDPAVAKHLDDLMKRGENLAKSLRLPDEIYGDTISELKELASVGAITQETFERAFTKAAEDLDNASMRAVNALRPLNVGAVTRHSSAGFSAVTSGANANKQLVQLNQRQLEESRKQTRLHEEANRLYRESQTAVKVVQI